MGARAPLLSLIGSLYKRASNTPENQTKTHQKPKQGFLPESFDAAVTDWLYPSYSPQILLFLGMSSLYGLFKTGKLPGQKQL